MSTAGIIFSNLNNNTLSLLTADRTVAAIPFACRYRLIDFALSNMIHANISEISVVTNYNYRSLVDHIGSGKDWDLARRRGGISLISPFQSATPTQRPEVYKTHLEALQAMKENIARMSADEIVMSDCEYICNIDLRTMIERHRISGADMTILTIPCRPDWTSDGARLLLSRDKEGYVTGGGVCREAVESFPYISIDIFILGREFLLRMLSDAEAAGYTSLSRDIICRHFARYNFRMEVYDGYVASVSNFNDYFSESIRLTGNTALRTALLGNDTRPILTNVHNSAPVAYREGCCVRSAMIADDCVIEGTVENSILFRGVKVGRGSVVKNCILFGNTYVGENSTLNCVVADKSVCIGDGRVLSGHITMPMYIPKNRKV